ncbi:MAG: glycosyltransferase [Ignavibacteria bacterium]|jgi:GalNAc-alpha-(1->4)-GalNAc-alpha-(1->3)-diNAcBac-PP-undecaprenol alpha-1,4-N-acetyl-D-galactosaminyltransferase
MTQLLKVNKIKIALVVPSLHAGGMERVMSELANYFTNFERLEIHLVLFGRSPILFYTVPQNVIVHKHNYLFNNKLRFWEAIKRLLFIRNVIKKINPNTILSFGTQWNNFVLLALLNTKFPIYVSDRGSPIREYKFPHESLRKILYKHAAGIIVQTQKAFDILKAKNNKYNIKVIGNPINLISDKSYYRDKTILSVGRLIDSKHHDRLIKIFSKLKNTDWKLVIVGGDGLKQNNSIMLQKLIKKLKLEDKIELVGEKKDVSKYYLTSRIFAFTSSVEGFPNVIGEALSAGLPSIAYDCIAGPSEMLKSGYNGFLIPVFDDDLFLEKLQLLMYNDTLRNEMSTNATKSIKNFSKEKIGQQFLEFILPCYSRIK